MSSSGRARAPVLLAAAGLAAAAAWLAAGGLRSFTESPETAVRRALEGAQAASFEVAPRDGGAPVRVEVAGLRWSDVVVTRAGGARAEVVAVAGGDGGATWRGGRIDLAYLGRERLGLVRCDGAGWCPEGSPLPRLAGVVALLARRADALVAGDPGAYAGLVGENFRDAEGGREEVLRRVARALDGPQPTFRVLAWQVRVERARAEVGEDYELGTPPRRLRARLDLAEEGGRWMITGGL